jgi:hypothetical protein
MSVLTTLAPDGTTPAVAASPADVGASQSGRREAREARRARRRLAGVVVGVVIACLLMTILIVGMARDRPVRDVPPGAAAVAGVAAGPASESHPPVHTGATASEGGHR